MSILVVKQCPGCVGGSYGAKGRLPSVSEGTRSREDVSLSVRIWQGRTRQENLKYTENISVFA